MVTAASGPASVASTGSPRRVPVGRISGVFGIRGWVRVFSYTDPRDNVLQYSPWLVTLPDGPRPFAVRDGHAHGAGVVAALDGVDTREAAAALIGCELEVEREALGEPAAGQYYWADLEGLAVVTRAGVPLGTVRRLFATGANDVMEVVGERRHLLPFVPGQVVLDVDLPGRTVVVDWDPDWAD
jgi:16S rRNA processing protein RimM